VLLGNAVRVLDQATCELPWTANHDELQRTAVALRAGCLQIMSSTSAVITGIGALELATDLRMMLAGADHHLLDP
jgi:hypothetical protein